MDELLYSEGAGPATWSVVVASFIAAAVAGSAWLRELTSLDPLAGAAPGRAVSTAVVMAVALTIGLGGVETLVRRRIVLTATSLRVGREVVPLSRLAQPVMAGERVPESVRSAARLRNALPSGCRALGEVPRAIPGQGTVTVVGSEPREVLVIYSWRPQAFAHFLGRALESADDAADTADDWP